MRMVYLGEKRVNPKALPPLLFAAIIFEGGIIGFDTNIQTGGIGARLLGIGGDIKYRLDTITVYLRAVSTKTGQVLASVTTHKTIASVGLQGGVFKYIAIDKILEAEAGFTKNEPDQLAVQQAIEKAVYTMVLEGADVDIWSFADKNAQAALIGAYREHQPLATSALQKEKADHTAEPDAKKEVAAAPKTKTDKSGTSAPPDDGAKSADAKPASPAAAAAKPDKAASRKPAAAAKPTGWSTSLVTHPPAPKRAASAGRSAGYKPKPARAAGPWTAFVAWADANGH
jgi:hypothetical protein